MALRWLLQSACHVLGNPNEIHPNEEAMNVAGKSSKVVVINGGLMTPTSSSINNNDNMVEWCPSGFQMPLHYPRYNKSDYDNMEEWKVDLLLNQYGLTCKGTLQEKRQFAMGAFLWPNQY